MRIESKDSRAELELVGKHDRYNLNKHNCVNDALSLSGLIDAHRYECRCRSHPATNYKIVKQFPEETNIPKMNSDR